MARIASTLRRCRTSSKHPSALHHNTIAHIRVSKWSADQDFHDSASQVDLASINLGLLNLGSLNLQDQISVAQGILALMNSFCLGNAVNINALLSLGLNNQVQMLLELAQLAQLQSLGFLNVFGVQSLIQSNLLFGNQLNAFNLGEC